MQLDPNIKLIAGHCKLKQAVLTVDIWICALLPMTVPKARKSKDKNNLRQGISNNVWQDSG